MTEEITAHTDVSCVMTTRANKVEKRTKPLHVVKSKEVNIDSKELQRLQECDQSLNKIRTLRYRSTVEAEMERG